MTDDVSPRLHPRHGIYGICGGCRQLKHVRPDGRLRNHNRFTARGTAVAQLRCSGSGAPSVDRLPAAPEAPARRSA